MDPPLIDSSFRFAADLRNDVLLASGPIDHGVTTPTSELFQKCEALK